jgi:ATP-binding cassette subfamily E protein 1
LSVEDVLSILDYLSDFICVLYGQEGYFYSLFLFLIFIINQLNLKLISYDVVTFPMGVGDGINVFLACDIPSENMRFRPFELSFIVFCSSLKIFLFH